MQQVLRRVELGPLLRRNLSAYLLRTSECSADALAIHMMVWGWFGVGVVIGDAQLDLISKEPQAPA